MGSVRDHRRELAELLRERSGELEDAELSEHQAPEPPPALIAHARKAA